MVRDEQLLLAPGSLWELAVVTARQAAAKGAFQPIATTVQHAEQAGVRFVVRMLAGERGAAAAQAKEERATAGTPTNVDPFLPYDPDLFVAGITPQHVCLLNKFTVIDHHLLIVTRAFEPQDEPLNQADFVALAACMAEIDGLAFYNAGKLAGASQRHKHLQLAPLPLDPAGTPIPIAAAFGERARPGQITVLPALPFRHAFAWLDPAWTATPAAAASYLLAFYARMLEETGVWQGSERPPRPYNWLATRSWMLMAPRVAEEVEGVPVNALGFAGSLLVRDPDQLAWLRGYGPMNLLKAVAGSGA
ncbi:MAG: phosphorylase [Caldilineaceae bacterium]|nr:phosphorylase [Caldilineaceae bacterium]